VENTPCLTPFTNGRRSSLQGIIVTPEQELPIKTFGLEMKGSSPTFLANTEHAGRIAVEE